MVIEVQLGLVQVRVTRLAFDDPSVLALAVLLLCWLQLPAPRARL